MSPSGSSNAATDESHYCRDHSRQWTKISEMSSLGMPLGSPCKSPVDLQVRAEIMGAWRETISSTGLRCMCTFFQCKDRQEECDVTTALDCTVEDSCVLTLKYPPRRGEGGCWGAPQP